MNDVPVAVAEYMNVDTLCITTGPVSRPLVLLTSWLGLEFMIWGISDA